MLLAIFSLSLLIPVGWIIGTELSHDLDNSRILSRIQVQMLAEHAALLFSQTDGTQIDLEGVTDQFHAHDTVKADLVVLYDRNGLVLYARQHDRTLEAHRITDVPLLRGIAPETLQNSGQTEFETEQIIGAALQVPNYPYRLLVGHDRQEIFSLWLSRALPIFLVVFVLVVVILALTRTMHREIYNRFKAEEGRAQEGLRYLESLRVLAGGLAHKVNNQMMVVIGNLDILVDELDPSPRIQRFTTAIRSAAKQASDLSGKMLVTAGTAHVHRQPHSLSTLLQILSTTLQETTDTRSNVTTTVDTDHRNITVAVDPDYLKIAVTGLVANAVEAYPEATAPKGVTLHLSVTQWEPEASAGNTHVKYSTRLIPGRYVSLSVQDQGDGIPEETLNHLFEPFFSTRFLGRGLGMTAVDGIARQHSGGVIVETQERVGTTVSVMIPLDDPHQ